MDDAAPPESSTLALSDYYDRQLVTDVAVAPGGDRLAVVVAEADGAEDDRLSSLFVVPTDGSRDPHRLTRQAGVADPAWSPDGSRLGFLATREEDVELRATKAPDADAVPAATDDEAADDPDDPDDPAEIADGDAAADGDEDEDADEAEDEDEETAADETQVWMFDLALGGDARQVTTRTEGVTEFDWGPDGERIVIAARDPTDAQREYLDEREDDGPIEIDRLQHKADGVGWLDDVRTYLFVVDVASRETRRLDDAYAGGATAALRNDALMPAWGGVAGRIAFVANHAPDADDTDALDLFTIAPDGTDRRRLTDGDVLAMRPRWGPEGDRLAYLVADPENVHVPTDVRVHGPAGTTVLTADLDRTVSFADWSRSDALLAYVADGGRTRPVELDLDGGRRDVFPDQDDATGVFAFAAGVDATSATAGIVVTGPSEWYAAALDLAAACPAPVRVADPARELLDRVDVAFERITYESAPDVEIEGLVTAPPGALAAPTAADAATDTAADTDIDADMNVGATADAGDAETTGDAAGPERPLPVIVDIHGGPTYHDEPRYSFRHHYWVARGYVVLQVNYRGSTSYGRAFSEAIRGEWGPREAADIAGGVAHLVDRGVVDPDRVFVTGFSQGGINTAYVLAHTDVATAGAAEHGIYDAASAFGTDDSHNWWESDFGLPWAAPDTYRAASSLAMVDEIDAPLLLTAGEEDWRCPPTQAEQLYVALRKCAVPSKLVVYPGVSHDRGPPDVATHRLATITEWFRTHDPAVTETDDETSDAASS